MDDPAETTASSPPPAERIFPPWSVGRIVFWIAVGVVLSVVIGWLIGIGVAAGSIWLGWGVGPGTVQFAALLGQFMYGPLVFLIVVFLLKRKGFLLSDAWGPFALNGHQLGLVMLAGIAFMSTVDLIIRVCHFEIPPTGPIAWDWRLLLTSEIITTAFLPAVAEELLFRGLLYRAFRLRLSAIDAAILSALIFTLVHTSYFRFPLLLSGVFVLGLVCAILLERTRSLNSSIAFHFAANATTITTGYFVQFSS